MRIHPFDNPVYAQILVAIHRGHDTAPSITKRINDYGTLSERGRQLKPDDIRHYLRTLRAHEFVTKKSKQHYFIDYGGIGLHLQGYPYSTRAHSLAKAFSDEVTEVVVGRMFLTLLNQTYPVDRKTGTDKHTKRTKSVTINNTIKAMSNLFTFYTMEVYQFSTSSSARRERSKLFIEDEETKELRPLTQEEGFALGHYLTRIQAHTLSEVDATHREGWLVMMGEENKKRGLNDFVRFLTERPRYASQIDSTSAQSQERTCA